MFCGTLVSILLIVCMTTPSVWQQCMHSLLLRWFPISDSTLIHSCSMFMQPWYTVSDICWQNTFSRLYSPTYSLLREVEWFIMTSLSCSLSCSHVQWTLDYVLQYNNVTLHMSTWLIHVTLQCMWYEHIMPPISYFLLQLLMVGPTMVTVHLSLLLWLYKELQFLHKRWRLQCLPRVRSHHQQLQVIILHTYTLHTRAWHHNTVLQVLSLVHNMMLAPA